MNILPIGTVVRLKNGTQKVQFAKKFSELSNGNNYSK